MSNKIPVTVLTGFLGSGKTTLLNRILSEEHGLRIAVIENEFGEIGIDQDLVINADEEVFQMNNGCICCTVRGDLIRILGDLAESKEKFDRVILETTGLADPGPVAQTFFVDQNIQQQYELDGIVTLIDAKHVTQHFDDATDEVMAQVAFADKVILNKIDLVTPEQCHKVKGRIKGINQVAQVYSATMADAPIHEILDIGGFDLARAVEMKTNFLEPEYPFEWGGIWQLPAGQYRFSMANGPDPDMAILLTDAQDTSEDGVLTLAENNYVHFSNEAIPKHHGDDIITRQQCYRLNLEGQDNYEFSFTVESTKAVALFSQHTPEEFDLQLFNHKHQELYPVAEHYFNAQHEHDDEVSSVSIALKGRFNLDKINAWLNVFVQVKGVDIYRMKGVLGVTGETDKIIFQGVHMSFSCQAGQPWGSEEVLNRMVFIGKDLDEDFIRYSLESCLDEK